MHNQTNQTNQNANDMEIVFAELVESPNKLAATVSAAETRCSPAPRKTAGQFIESLLDPKSLQTLMWFGSGLLVVGLMVWLWSVGVFANPIVAASVMGGANLAALVVGLVAAKSQRYSWAGKAITLLSSMVMPLNLWFYHSHGLLTLDQNGLLCIPALMMTAIYGVVARILKDANFVYASVAGVVLTGLIFLADCFVGTWQLAPPAILLVVIGIVCILAERLFTTDPDSPFSRKTFGKAFFASGHVVMAAGLFVTLVGNWFEIGTQTATFHIASLALSAVGFYAYLYSLGFVNSQATQKGKEDRSIATAIYLGGIAVCLLIFCLAIVEVIAFKMTASLLIGALSAVAIGFQTFALAKRNEAASQFGLVASSAAMIISAVVLLMSGFTLSADSLVTGWLVLSMALNVASFVLGGMFPHEKENGLLIGSVIGIAVSGLMMMLSIMILFEVSSVASVLVVLMTIPLALQLTGDWKKELESKLWFYNASQIAAAVLISLALVFVGIVGQEFTFWDQVLFCVFSLLNTILFVRCDGKTAGVVSAVSMMAAIGFGAWAFGLGGFAVVQIASGIGIAMMAIGRLAKLNEKAKTTPQSLVSLRLETMGTLIIGLASSLSFGVFLWHVLDNATWSLTSFMGIQLAVSGVAALLSTDKQLTKLHFGAAFGQFASVILTVVMLTQLSFFNQVEIMFSAAGLFVLLLSHVGWFRENGQADHTESSISAGLWIGSILAVAPMLISLLLHRVVGFNVSQSWLLIHNLGVLAVGMAMLLAGLACRIRSTTIVGAGTVVAYVLSLVTLLHIPAAMQNIAVYMMIGGGVFFGVAIVLSMYRSHLLAMPEKMRRGQGIFQVLKWR